jgi:DNA-binding SARP family transcriptional activator
VVREAVAVLAARSGRDDVPVVHLLAGPSLWCGSRRVDLPAHTWRPLAFLALCPERIDRRHLAARLWPDETDRRAGATLRSTLCRLRAAAGDLLDTTPSTIGLAESVLVDIRLLEGWADRLRRHRATADDLNLPADDLAGLELLAGWDDEWVVVERERTRQRLLHAVEMLGTTLLAAGRHAEAIDAALAVVAAEPLRETAQRILLEAHLAAGNWAEGHRAHVAYRALLQRELGIRPAAEHQALLNRRLLPRVMSG